MIIILEGCDRCGKTTIANKLHDEHGFEIVKFSQPKKDPYIEAQEKLKKAIGKNVVLDRSWYGELVYGPLYRGESQLADWQVRNLELRAMSLGSLIIYCHDSIKNIKQRFKEDNETFAKPELIGKMLESYKIVMNNSRFPVIKHQIGTKYDLTKGLILEEIVRQLSYVEPKTIFKTAIGNQLNPKLILIGDKRNQNQPYKAVQQPFDVGPASEFLFKSLEQAKIDLNYVLLVNQASPELPRIIKSFPDASWLALGDNAHRTLNKMKREHYKAPHPQFLSRFHHSTGIKTMVKILKESYDKTRA